jgi:hypothetical protein
LTAIVQFKKYTKMKRLLLLMTFGIRITCLAQQEHERWDVKTLTDGFTPNLNSVQKVTVAKIEPKAKIRVRNNQPRLNFEKQVVKISGKISDIKLEDDGDYHIEVTDGTMDDSTMVCEAVDPSNHTTANSPYASKFRTVRAKVSQLHKGDQVTFTGVLFQDKYHSPSTHRTRNFVEMHPILIVQ